VAATGKPTNGGEHFVRAEVPKAPWHSLAPSTEQLLCGDYFYFFTPTPTRKRPPTPYESCGRGQQRRPPICGSRTESSAWSMNPIPLPSRRSGVQSGPSISWPIPTFAPVTMRCCRPECSGRSSRTAARPMRGLGELSEDGATLFRSANAVLSADQRQTPVSRSAYAVSNTSMVVRSTDSRRKADVLIDPSLLPLGWTRHGPSGNTWYRTKIGVTATFVESENTETRRRMESGEVGDRSAQSPVRGVPARRPEGSGRRSPLVSTLWRIRMTHRAGSDASQREPLDQREWATSAAAWEYRQTSTLLNSVGSPTTIRTSTNN